MAARRANRQEGEEVALWKSTQSDIKSVVAEINASNDQIRQIAAIESRLATIQDSKDPADSKLHTELLQQLDTLYRAGVKLNDAVVKKMGDVKEALGIVRALAGSKEDDAKGPGASTGPSSRSASFHATAGPGGRSSSRAGKLDKDRGRAERAERAEREREMERERERERERDREQREREVSQKEREHDKERDKERDDADKDKQDLYDFDGTMIDSPHPSPVGGGHARKLGVRAGGPSSTERSTGGNGSRDSVPPRDTSSKAGSAEPATAATGGVVGSSATRAKVVFAEAQDVAFKPKSSETGEWFLGKVKRVVGEGKGRRYIVKDEDPDLPESDRREYKMSASGMIPIPSPKMEIGLPKLDKGKMVLALYPDSTTFYKAEVMGIEAATGSVSLRFEGEEQSGTQQTVDRRFVVDYRE